MNAQLQQFVREALARGLSRDEIRATLTSARWRAEEIDAELERWGDGPAGLPVPRRRVSLSAREAFMHLVIFATLYTFAYSAGAILFVLISRWFPDAAASGWEDMGLSMLRGSVAACVTAFPIYLWTSWLVGRSLVHEPEKRGSGVRRWLTYLTLFVAVVTLIGNFAGVITNLLSGALTTRVLLQSAVVFGIAGLVFGHYLLDLRRDESEGAAPPARPLPLGRVGAILTALVLVVGFLNVGSPARNRSRVIDANRVQALDNLSNQLQHYVDENGALPQTLESLPQIAASYYREHCVDPATQQPFAYAAVDSATYTLGATFDTADSLDADGDVISPEWRHTAGPVTFTRQVHRKTAP